MSTSPQPTLLSIQPVPLDDTKLPDRGHTLTAIPQDVADRDRVFQPPHPDAKPSDLFEVRANRCTLTGFRFIRKGDNERSQALFFIDGACTNNGVGPGVARGGAAVVVAPLAWYKPINYPLPVDGQEHTNNRAELYAAIVSLGLRRWPGEGFEKIILATDSEYLVLGISEHIHKWRRNGWKTTKGGPVKNRDLWEKLHQGLRDLESIGCLVQFWLIPRTLNEADSYAKATPDSKRHASTEPIIIRERTPNNSGGIIATHLLERDLAPDQYQQVMSGNLVPVEFLRP